MHKLIEELRFDDGTRTYRLHPAVPNGCVVEGARHYSFELCRKSAMFGDVAVDQFWMDVGTIYGGSGRAARNHAVLIEHYNAQCVKAATIFQDDVLDSYVLAHVLPYMRRNGSRRIFDDAILPAGHRGAGTRPLVNALEEKLVASRDGELDMVSFHRQTNRLLGKPDMPPEADAAYLELAEELLGEGRRAVGRWGTNGLQIPIRKMQTWMKTFARRGGNEAKKLGLDMLTYEARAAVHRCYAAVWLELLPHLEKKYHLDQASVQYLRLMHCEFIWPSNLPNAYFHLFHGHTFALHPGLSLFFQSPTGGALIADYLKRDADADKPFRRLLHGFWVALLDYESRSSDYAESRKKTAGQTGEDDLGDLEARQTRGRGTRRLRGPRSEDGVRG